MSCPFLLLEKESACVQEEDDYMFVTVLEYVPFLPHKLVSIGWDGRSGT